MKGNTAMSPCFSSLALLLLIPALWIISGYLVARVSGWRRLAESYLPTTEQGERQLWLMSCRVGWVNYSGRLFMSFDSTSLHIYLHKLFRPGHPPVCVPWAEIKAEMVKGYMGEVLQLSFHRVPAVKLSLPGKIYDKLVQASNSRLLLSR